MTTKHFDILSRLKAVSGARVIVGISGGKDSLCTLDLLTSHGFTVYPYALYTCSGIQFWEKQLELLERRYSLSIPKFPHPAMGEYIHGGHYRHALPDFPTLKHSEVPDVVRAHYGDMGLWIANGEKMCDSLQRRGMMSACGGLDEKRRVAYPLAHWNDREVYAYLRHRRIQLPPDYSSGIGGSWGGSLSSDWLKWIQANYPEDFQRLERVYPHIRAALFREIPKKGRRA